MAQTASFANKLAQVECPCLPLKLGRQPSTKRNRPLYYAVSSTNSPYIYTSVNVLTMVTTVTLFASGVGVVSVSMRQINFVHQFFLPHVAEPSSTHQDHLLTTQPPFELNNSETKLLNLHCKTLQTLLLSDLCSLGSKQDAAHVRQSWCIKRKAVTASQRALQHWPTCCSRPSPPVLACQPARDAALSPLCVQ